jgi:hypothetical protein
MVRLQLVIRDPAPSPASIAMKTAPATVGPPHALSDLARALLD